MGKTTTHQPLNSPVNIERIKRIVEYDYSKELENYCEWVEMEHNDTKHGYNVLANGAHPIYKDHIFYDLFFLNKTLNNQ